MQVFNLVICIFKYVLLYKSLIQIFLWISLYAGSFVNIFSWWNLVFPVQLSRLFQWCDSTLQGQGEGSLNGDLYKLGLLYKTSLNRDDKHFSICRKLNLNKSLKFIHSNSYTGCFLVSQSSVTDTEYLLGGVKLESCASYWTRDTFSCGDNLTNTLPWY